MDACDDMIPSPMARPRRRILLLERRRCDSYMAAPQRQFAVLLALDARLGFHGGLFDATDARELARSEPYPPDRSLYASRRMTTLRQFERLRRVFAAAEDALYSTGPIDAALPNGCPDSRYTADLVFHYLGRGGDVAALTVETFERGRRGESLLAADRTMVAPHPARRK